MFKDKLLQSKQGGRELVVLRVMCYSMYLFVYASFCHGALKLDLSTLLTTCLSLNISSIDYCTGKYAGKYFIYCNFYIYLSKRKHPQ